MTSEAPYNPDTLTRIRHGASAADLGWTEQTYRRICKTHGIEPIPPAAVLIEKAAPVPTTSQAGDIAWCDATGELTRRRKALALAPKQAVIFGLLFAIWRSGADRYVPDSEVHSLLGHTFTGSLGTTIASLNSRLRGMGIEITGQKGPGGGYRLIVDDVA